MREATIRAYLAAMERKDLEGVLACFDPGAIIVSPVYGESGVQSFYETLFADTVSASVDIRTIYADASDQQWAAHFGYQWLRSSGEAMQTELVDLFSFAPESDRIARLRIIFAGIPAQQ